jgi:RNA polymerase sigma-32 factor
MAKNSKTTKTEEAPAAGLPPVAMASPTPQPQPGTDAEHGDEDHTSARRTTSGKPHPEKTQATSAPKGSESAAARETEQDKQPEKSALQAGEEAASAKEGAKEAALPAPRLSGQTLPMPSDEGGLAAYLQKIREFPILSPAEEYMLAKRWREHADTEAAHKLVTSHLRLVAKIAMGYRGYGLPISEIISEGNVGLMQAVKRFEPDKGFRLATYAMWWIKAAIQEYILRSWSLVKMGTTASQKKLFFNLRKLKGQIKALDEGDMKPEQVREIAERLGVSEEDVISMNRRLAGDASLNAPLKADGDSATEWQDWLVDEEESQEEKLAEREEYELRMKMLREAMSRLNDRERRIFEARRLREPPLTLEELSKEFGVSRERIRQIEVRAFEKVQKAMREMAAEQMGETG